MAWNDASNLSYAKSRKQIEGARHLLRVFKETMEAELEELPEGVLEHRAPRPAKVKDGVQESPPSYRFRVVTDTVAYNALLHRGERFPPITEVEVLDRVGRITDAQRAMLRMDKDDSLADWRIVGYEITDGTGRKARVKSWDPGYAAKLADWQGRRESPAPNDNMPAAPAKQISQVQEVPGFTLRVVWMDVARQEEPRRGALKGYLETGYYPPAFQKQRDEAFRIVGGRLARGGGAIIDLAEGIKDEILALALAKSPPERIAALLDLGIEVVRRVLAAHAQTPKAESAPEPAPKAPRAPRKPREKRPAAPERPSEA